MVTDASAKTVIHVATWGSDVNSGLDASAPKATLTSALIQSRGIAGSETIELAGGHYYLTQKLSLNSIDNGLAITSKAGETATLHGGPNVAGGWVGNGDGSYSKYIGSQMLAGSVEDLHINGDRVQVARYPNAGLGDFDQGYLLTAPGTGGTGTSTLKFTVGSLPVISDLNDLRISVYDTNQWANVNAKIASIDYATGTINLAETATFHRYGEGARFYLYNSHDLLDASNEFDYDSASKTLTVRPDNATELAAGNSVTAATLDTLIEITGASGITISDLGLTDTTYHGTDRVKPWDKNGGGAIQVVSSSDIVIAGNTIDNVGVGLNVQSSSGVDILDNHVTDVAGNGIYLAGRYGTTTVNQDVQIAGNTVSDTGQIFVESAGIWLQGTANSSIHDNLVSNSSQFGIMEGSVRTNGSDFSHDNIIEYNVIHNVNTATAEGAGIKLYGVVSGNQTDTIVRYNWIDGVTQSMTKANGTLWGEHEWSKDSYPRPIAPGINVEGYVSSTDIYGNVVTNSYGGIYLNGGTDNAIHDNLIHGGDSEALSVRYPSGTVMSGNEISQNIVYLANTNAAAVRVMNTSSDNGIVSFSDNLYDGPAIDANAFLTWNSRFAGGSYTGSFSNWASSAYASSGETNAAATLINAAASDYRPSATSPAWALGFDGLNERLHGIITGAESFPPSVSPPVVPPPPPPPPTSGSTTTIVLDVSGDPYGDNVDLGPYPIMELLVNGIRVGAPTVVVTDHDTGMWERFTFEAPIAGSAITQIGISFTNDHASTPYDPAKDRALYVEDVTANDVTFLPTAGTIYLPDGSTRVGNEKIAWTGVLKIGTEGLIPDKDAPATSFSVSVEASSAPYGDAVSPGPYAKFDLLVNGSIISTVEATADRRIGQWTEYNINVDMPIAQAHTLQIRYFNDYSNAGGDRNLYLRDLVVDGEGLNFPSATYYRTNGPTIAGTGNMVWRGTLEFNLDTLVHSA